MVLGLWDNSSDGRPKAKAKAKGLVIEEEPVSVKGASNEEPASGKSSVEEAWSEETATEEAAFEETEIVAFEVANNNCDIRVSSVFLDTCIF